MPDIDELVTDLRREGIISGTQTMADKLMRETVTFVSGTVLSMMGFVKVKPSPTLFSSVWNCANDVNWNLRIISNCNLVFASYEG